MIQIKTGNSEVGPRKINEVNSIGEMKQMLTEMYESTNNEVSAYNWDEDGNCCVLNVDENMYENDKAKMIDIVAERVEKFGWCRFFGADRFIEIRDISKK